MNIISILKSQKQQNIDKLIEECGMFFAFSVEQFNKNKTLIPEGEKYLSLGAGAYIPKNNFDKYINGMESINKDFNKKISALKQREELIKFELYNHEAFYTQDIESTVEHLSPEFSKEEIAMVYAKYK